MSFRIGWGQSYRLATLAKCCVQISFLSQRIGQIGMSLREIRPQFHGAAKMRDRGIGLILREQYPPQRVVTFGAARR